MGAIAAGFVSMGLATFGGVSMSLLNGHQTLNSPQNPAVIQDSQPTEQPHHHH
jgi:hypothetical protein